MIKHTLRRLRRMLVPAVGILLFAAILATVLCALQRSNDAELEKYNETYRSIPVHFTVTNLSATKSTNLNIPNLIVEAFELGFERFICDLQMVCYHSISDQNSGYMLVGITSTVLSPELWTENGCTVTWKEGYDEGIFKGQDLVCLVPEGMVVSTDEETGKDYLELEFSDNRSTLEKKFSCKFEIVGSYKGGDASSVYCPFAVCKNVFKELGEPFYVQSMRATLSNNDDLEALKNISNWLFAEPNPLGERTPWGEYGYKYYPFALDINDDLLMRTAETLQKSITTNRICAFLVLCLSASSGLLIGFLMVRSRKHEISLMRTMGTPDFSIYFSFMLEQMLCFAVGIALGGLYNLYHPALQLGILATVFFVGLTVALLIFLSKNLIITIKEDD